MSCAISPAAESVGEVPWGIVKRQVVQAHICEVAVISKIVLPVEVAILMGALVPLPCTYTVAVVGVEVPIKTLSVEVAL